MINEDFFRHCWLTLKRSKPRLRKFMDEIECTVEGAGKIIETKPSPKEKSEDKADDIGNQKPRPYVPV